MGKDISQKNEFQSTMSVFSLEAMTGLLSSALKNEELSGFLNGVFGVNVSEVLGDDGELDDIEAKGLLGTIGNFLVSLGVIEESDKSEFKALAKEEDVDIETAKGMSAFTSLDGNGFLEAINKAMMIHVSKTKDIPLEGLQKSYAEGANLAKDFLEAGVGSPIPEEDPVSAPVVEVTSPSQKP